jgi:hypothetical protein
MSPDNTTFIHHRLNTVNTFQSRHIYYRQYTYRMYGTFGIRYAFYNVLRFHGNAQ